MLRVDQAYTIPGVTFEKPAPAEKVIHWNPEGATFTSLTKVILGLYPADHTVIERAAYRRDDPAPRHFPHWSVCGMLETERGVEAVLPGDWLVWSAAASPRTPRWAVMTPVEYLRYQRLVNLSRDFQEASIFDAATFANELVAVADHSRPYCPFRCEVCKKGLMFPELVSRELQFNGGTLAVPGLQRLCCTNCKTFYTLPHQDRANVRIIADFRAQHMIDDDLIVRDQHA